MTAEKKSKNRLGWSGFLFVVSGSVIALVGTIITHV